MNSINPIAMQTSAIDNTKNADTKTASKTSNYSQSRLESDVVELSGKKPKKETGGISGFFRGLKNRFEKHSAYNTPPALPAKTSETYTDKLTSDMSIDEIIEGKEKIKAEKEKQEAEKYSFDFDTIDNQYCPNNLVQSIEI